MAVQLDGCCARMYRFILVVLNVLIFILGLLTLILAIVMKYTKAFDSILNVGDLNEVVSLGKIGTIAILFMVIGGFALLLSLIGLFGLCCLSKFLLIIYEIIVILLFAAHGIGLLVLVFGKGSIEDSYRKEMGNVVDRLNSNSTSPSKFNADCELMQTLSELFSCCGNKLPIDITNSTVRDQCCKSKAPTNGCTEESINKIVSSANNYLIIPSAIILTIEFIVIVITPLMICDIKRQSPEPRYKY